MMCKCGAVEDELHFMTVCSRYVAERNEMVRAIRETTNTCLDMAQDGEEDRWHQVNMLIGDGMRAMEGREVAHAAVKRYICRAMEKRKQVMKQWGIGR